VDAQYSGAAQAICLYLLDLAFLPCASYHANSSTREQTIHGSNFAQKFFDYLMVLLSHFPMFMMRRRVSTGG